MKISIPQTEAAVNGSVARSRHAVNQDDLIHAVRALPLPLPTKDKLLGMTLESKPPCGGTFRLIARTAASRAYGYVKPGYAVPAYRLMARLVAMPEGDPTWVAESCDCDPTGKARVSCKHLRALAAEMGGVCLCTLIAEVSEAAAKWETVWAEHKLGLASDEECNAAYRRLTAARARRDGALFPQGTGGEA